MARTDHLYAAWHAGEYMYPYTTLYALVPYHHYVGCTYYARGDVLVLHMVYRVGLPLHEGVDMGSRDSGPVDGPIWRPPIGPPIGGSGVPGGAIPGSRTLMEVLITTYGLHGVRGRTGDALLLPTPQ